MGIFFDQDWFDGRLEQAGLTRAAMARVTGMTIDEIEMVFSDRRELEGPEIHAIARVLDVTLGQRPETAIGALREYLKSNGDRIDRSTAQGMLLLVTAMPEYQLC